MRKIPVWPTIAASYRLVFAKYVSLFGAVWLPLMMSNVFSYFLMVPYLKRLGEALHNGDAAALAATSQSAFASSLAFVLLTLVVMSAVSVAVTKEALGSREPPAFVYYAIGMDEVRVFGGYLFILGCGMAYILSVAFIAGSVVYLVLVVTMGSGNSLTPVTVYNSIQPYLILAIEVSYLYFVVRVMSFMTVVSVAEKRFGLWRSWQLSRGNVVQLTAVALATVIPVLACQAILGFAVFAPALSHISGLAALKPAAAVGSAIPLLVPYIPLLWIVQVAAAPVFYGLCIVPAAIAYRPLLRG